MLLGILHRLIQTPAAVFDHEPLGRRAKRSETTRRATQSRREIFQSEQRVSSYSTRVCVCVRGRELVSHLWKREGVGGREAGKNRNGKMSRS